MARTKRMYALPDYKTVTTDVDVYINEWRKQAEPIERELGLRLVGFDPGFVFAKPTDTGDGPQLNLPVWFVNNLNAVLTANNPE